MDEALRQRLLVSLAKGMAGAFPHPSTPLMPEDVRKLSEAFGSIFHLWPPAERRSERVRLRWAEELRETAKMLDGTPLDPIPYWRELAETATFTISRPAATVKAVRALAAKAGRPHRADYPPEEWI